jgi:hypothetical protein
MQPSLPLRIALSAAVLALSTVAVTLWIFRCSLLGLIGITRGKTA